MGTEFLISKMKRVKAGSDADSVDAPDTLDGALHSTVRMIVVVGFT